MSLAASLVASRFEAIAARTKHRFRVEMADRSVVDRGQGETVLVIRFNNAAAEMRTVLFGHIGLLEAYFDGTVDLDGDLGKAMAIAFDSGFSEAPGFLVWFRNQWHEQRFSNRTAARAKRNARFHYGLGADFYGRWLDDPYMMYTCAYWKPGTQSIEEAQINKMEHVCRKVQLNPGDRVLDVGCGFGGFMFYAQERHGASVRGTNTTTEQVDWLKRQISERGLGDALEIREADFRTPQGTFDKVVSIGVLEHAGRDQLESVVRAHADALVPGGLGMLHFIGHVDRRDTEFFIRKHVFPGGWIPSLSETLNAMEKCGLEIVDVENLRRHYALTLDAWAERFDARWPEIQNLDPTRFDERFRRIWRAYLVGCAEMFRSPRGRTNLFQVLFSKGNVTRESYPMSRAFLYQGDAAQTPLA